MNFKRLLLLISSLLLVALICMGSVAAADSDDNMTDDALALEVDDNSDLQEINLDDELSVSNDSAISEPRTIIVGEYGDSVNEMNTHIIKNAIAGANAGDTIIIRGSYYEHCHLIVNKQLTIISDVGTTLSPCSNAGNKDSGHQGIFYITSQASGTVIDGFTFVDDLGLTDDEAYGILVRGACDVAIQNCKISTGDYADSIRLENANNALIQNTTVSNSINGIKIKNSKNTIIRNSVIKNSNHGVNIVDSSQITVTLSDITNNKIAGISFAGDSSYLTVSYNNITTNGNGINLTSARYVYILSNSISFNKINGVYVNCNITKIEIRGNFLNQNRFYEIYNDHRVRNLFVRGGEQLQIIENNYMVGTDDAAYDRPIWRQVYDYKPGVGQYSYDAANDVYTYVGSGGDYDGHQSGIFLGYVFQVNEYMDCPNIYYQYGAIPWSQGRDYTGYYLRLSEITQVRNGVYSISIVDGEGNIATDISSVPITFYINKNKASASPQEGDVYRTVIMRNGTATARFDAEDFNETGNVVMACAPGIQHNLYSSDIPYKTLKIDDSNIPGNVVQTNISVSNLNTYPNSKVSFVATLTNSNGTPISGKELTFSINSKKYTGTTDINGKATIQIYESVGSYVVNVNFLGDDIDFTSSSAKATVNVKKLAVRLYYSNVFMIPNRGEYYSVTLKDAYGNGIYNQLITFKVNGKTLSARTNKYGVAKVYLKFNKQTAYNVIIRYAGSVKYNGISKTAKITVKYSSKVVKLFAPRITLTPKTTKLYVVSLKDVNGKGIAKQRVTIKVNFKTYSRVTNVLGNAGIYVKFNALKNYKVIASYNGNKIYKQAVASGVIKVAKIATVIIAPKLNVLPNTASTYTATLKTSAGKALANQKVAVKFNGKTYSRVTNTKGQISLNVNLKVEKTYPVVINYLGNAIYKASKVTGSITVSKGKANLITYDMIYAVDSLQKYSVTLKDSSGKVLSNQKITFEFNNNTVWNTTDLNGVASINLNSSVGNFNIEITYAGNDKYLAASVVNAITISNKTNTVFINGNLPNGEIQNILDSCDEGSNVEFRGNYFTGISLDINKGLNIYSEDGVLLTASSSKPVFNIKASNVNITFFAIVGDESDAIVIFNADNVKVSNCIISNELDHSKMEEYLESTISMPGYGISILNSTNVEIINNSISAFESGIFAENSSDLVIRNNLLRENNYGVKYGFGVANTQIISNFITENIGLYTMYVPEGPRGYGIFLNNSAVNVSITDNNITWNHLGISIDSNYSTGIVVTRNWISDNVLEGMRFNAGYDLAENAIEPVVTDNAIYRNARGPSMMILGELSANPGGIYGGGLTNDSLKLKLDPNWYGRNQLAKWDNDTGIVGYGTMCPRISTSPIQFNEIVCVAPGTYSITFYKNGEVASNLPVFEMYATLNNGTEVRFYVVNGVGEFEFDLQDLTNTTNKIDISIGSLRDETRYFEVLMSETFSSA